MKNIIVLLISVFVLWSCNSQKESKEDALKRAVEQAELSEQIENDLFLGFKFGMTEKEVRAHYNTLIDEGKIYLNSSRRYQYDLNDEYGIIYYITFIPQYYDNSLYEMLYPIERANISIGNDHIMVASFFRSSTKENGYDWFITEDILNDPIYTFVKNNLVVTFSNTVRPAMKYTNAPIDKAMSENKKLEIEKKANESASEF